MLWPPRTSCGPRSSVPPVTRSTDVQPSFIFCASSGCVSISSSTMSFTFIDGVRAPCANAKAATSGNAVKSAIVLFTDPPLREKGSYPFFDSMRRKRGTTPFSLTRYALVIVLRAEAFEQLDCIGERLDPLHRAVGHVRRRLSDAVHERHIGAFRDQIRNHLVVAARGGVVQRRVAVGVARVDVGVQLFDEILHRGEHAGRREAVRV